MCFWEGVEGRGIEVSSKRERRAPTREKKGTPFLSVRCVTFYPEKRQIFLVDKGIDPFSTAATTAKSIPRYSFQVCFFPGKKKDVVWLTSWLVASSV